MFVECFVSDNWYGEFEIRVSKGVITVLILGVITVLILSKAPGKQAASMSTVVPHPARELKN